MHIMLEEKIINEIYEASIQRNNKINDQKTHGTSSETGGRKQKNRMEENLGVH